MTTLYGQGAITISDDRTTYAAHNGAIAVPDHLVPRVLQHGWARHPRPAIDASIPVPLAIDPFPAIDATLDDAILLVLFSSEAIARGYREDAANAIASGRLRHLRSGGDGYGLADAPPPEDEPVPLAAVAAPFPPMVAPVVTPAAASQPVKPAQPRNNGPRR